MHKATISYRSGPTELHGYLCHKEGEKGSRPAVIVAHAWRGLDAFAREKAEALANLGYVAFAADLYGNKEPIVSDEDAGKAMMPLFLDRKTLQARIKAAFDEVSKHPLVDKKRIGAIGFCFGGLTVIELLRSGAPVRAVVSFHGVLSNHMGNNVATTVPIASNIKGSLLMLNGHDDPLFTKQDIAELEDELTKANVDWVFTDYGHTAHAFTNLDATNPHSGLRYHENSARRAWAAMRQFFEEAFS